MKEEHLQNRIDSLDEERHKQLKRSHAHKLTPFQERLSYYFSELFSEIDEHNIANYYYFLIYLYRRIIFVFTALYLSEHA